MDKNVITKKCPFSKNAMRIEINNKIHFVIYIEYLNKIPHDVKTVCFIETANEPYWRLYHWDGFANEGDKKDIRLYNSGSGGCETDVDAPQWIDGYIGTFWLADGIKFRGIVKNGIKIHVPIRLKGYFHSSVNPFKAGEITHSREYCEVCGYESVDVCWEHQYQDSDGVLRYKDNNCVN